MKKLVISAIALALTAFATVDASTTINPATEVATVQQLDQEKVAVKPEDLPDAVKRTLSADPYTGWEVSQAFLVTGENNAQHYEVELKRGEETATAKLDQDGNKVE
ncbi:hypothetical protein GCM10027275_25860 [Rhabdobacter roseus]|uniref:Uncharacterized protein YjdB n=1 Tax=Rhabdobacter roseus TaxID=1655419 RepID=A0A840TSI5_9BACT|nr:hypothetical protein [Rhabdobacter roseus]MBB5284532.1 uncharacterized protein YjdB [Rhabdobacter roseus]